MSQPMHVTHSSVDAPLRGSVQITFRENFEDEPVVVELDVPQLLELLGQLTTYTSHVVSWAANSIAVGDCGTCKNVGLITVKNRHDRDEQVYCPDCHEKRGTGSFPEYPRIGGGVR